MVEYTIISKMACVRCREDKPDIDNETGLCVDCRIEFKRFENENR